MTADQFHLLLSHPDFRDGMSEVTHPEVMETHISFVILTPVYAYKIKKTCKLSFLDFSTLALRQHYCAKELMLNRRLAPQMYLSVLPIKQINHFIDRKSLIRYSFTKKFITVVIIFMT